MATSEPARLALCNPLEEVFGPEHAETLMSCLPLQPSVELATRADIKDLRDELGEFRKEVREETRLI